MIFNKIAAMSLLIAATSSFAAGLEIGNDTITLVVPSPPSGSTSFTAVKLAQFSVNNGTAMIVSHKPGGERMLGTNFVAAAVPDGKTLLVGGTSEVIMGPLLNLPVVKFDKDSFVPVSSAVVGTYAIIVRNDFPANNLKEFISVISKDPLSRQTGAFSSSSKLVINSTFSLANVKPDIISYIGENQLLMDIISGNLPIALAPSSSRVKELMLLKKLKVIAVTSPERLPEFPGVSTLAEIEPGLSFQYYFGVWAPAGTPKDKIIELHAMFSKITSDPKFISEVTSMDIRAVTMTLPELNSHTASQRKFYARLIEQSKNK